MGVKCVKVPLSHSTSSLMVHFYWVRGSAEKRLDLVNIKENLHVESILELRFESRHGVFLKANYV